MNGVKAAGFFVLSFAVISAAFLLRPAVARSLEFSADMVIEPKGDEPLNGKIYVKGEMVRVEEALEEGETQITITRPDKKLTWEITPEEKMYMERPYLSEDKMFEEWTGEKEKTSKFLADETIDGLPAKKFESVEDGDKVYYWVSAKYPFPLKREDDEAVLQYKNIKEDPIPDSMFEIPAGYKKMAMPEIPEEPTDTQEAKGSKEVKGAKGSK